MSAQPDQRLRSEVLNLFQYVQRLREELARMTQRPEGQTRFERMSDQLDAILASTDDATQTILESFEDISAAAGELSESPDPKKGQELCDRITGKAMSGMEACGFQDLTGQRVSKIILSLRFIEERVEAMMELYGRDGIEDLGGTLHTDDEDLEDHKDGFALRGPQLSTEAISQEEIDKLFA